MTNKPEGVEAGVPPDHARDVLERVSDGLVALDRNWRYVYINSQAAALFGRRPEELIGRHIWTEFPEGVGQPFQLAYERAMAEQVFIELENYYEPWDRWFENRIYPSPDGVSIFFHEITERKRAEQAARENGALLGGHNQVLELIARREPLDRTLDLLLRVIEAQCPGMLCSILLLDPDGLHVRHGAAPSLPRAFVEAIDGQPIGPSAGSCGTAAFRREPVVVEDIATDSLWADYRRIGPGVRPARLLVDADRRRGASDPGTFALYFRAPGRPSEHHRRLIELSTHTAAIAISQHRETQALRISEERLRLAVTGGNVGIWEWTLGPDRLELNEQFKAIMGWPSNVALTQQMFLEVIHTRTDPKWRLRSHAQSADGTTFDCEFRIQSAGTLKWIAVTGRGEYDAAGKAVRMIGVGRDVTNRKRADEAASRRETQLAEAQHLARLGSYEWDIRTNRVYRSDELCRIFGVERDGFEPTFEAYLERVHPDDRASNRGIVENAFRTGTPFQFEERILRPDGSIRLLHSEGRWVIEQGVVVKLLGICQDITERRHAEEELRRSEERFQIVARATNDAIWDWDLGTDGLWWNQGITTLFDYPAAEVGEGIAWRTACIHPEDLHGVVSGIAGVMRAGRHFWSREYRFRRSDGAYATVFDRAFVIYDAAGQPVRMIGAMSDITERKQTMEELEQRVVARTSELREKNRELENEVVQRQRVAELLRTRNEELKSFAYTVSHDLKAPLRGIAGYAQELQRRHRAGLGDRAVSCIEFIITAARNLDRLIEDLLHYSRLDAENPSATDVDLGVMVQAILTDRKVDIQEQNLSVSVALDVVRLHAWERGLLQILANLIDNAFKYSRGADVRQIRITSEQADDRVRIAVADNGIGFDMKYHDRIFGLFNRLVRPEDFDGTGAGLAIVKKIADKSGWKMWAESQPGHGATFFLELPAGAGVAAPVAQ